MDKDSEVTSDKYGEQVEGFENIAGGALKLSSITSEVNDNPEMLDKDPETRKRLYQAGKEFNETYNKNIDYMIEGWHRPEVAKKEMLVLEEKIAKEKNPEMKNLLTARYNYLEQEAHPIRSIKEGFVSGFKEGSADAITLYAASKIPVFGKYVTVGTIIYGGVKHAINAAKEEPKIAITFKQANDIKRIAPEFHKDAESSFIIGKKSDVSNSVLIGAAEYYYKNNKTPDKRLGNSTGYLAGGVVAYKGISIAESKYNSLKTLTSDPNLVSANEVTNGEQLLLENKVNSVQGKVFINDGTPGGTTVANQIRFTDSSGNMLMLQNNLTTGELSLQGINSSGQRIFEKSLTPYPANALIGTSSSSQMLVGDGAVSQVQSTLIPKANVNNMDLLKAFKRVEGEKNYYYSKLTTTKEVAGVKFRFPSIEYALNERAAEELQKNPLTMPIEMQEHIFGEIKHLRNGTIKATGGHAVSDQVKISDITNIQYNNVFQAKVEIYDPVTNQYILKSNNNGLSTFFPVYWTKDRILIEAESAFGNKVPHSNPNMLNKGFYEGKTKSGVKVDIGRKTLYPQERQ
ncbi:EndoU domain-containing protein [Fusobacterium animalis]|uniref:EndoU domain-containing protein n=1 Tax=Fusobacterium animalis TaxID=76859 RepID=UPI003CC5D7A3